MFESAVPPCGDDACAAPMPLAAAIAGLGTVLCLAPRELPLRFVSAMLRECAARGRLRGRVVIERWGVTEALEPIDDEGLALLALQRLPDSDYLAWEQALAAVPVQCGDGRGAAPVHGWRRMVRLAPDDQGQPRVLPEDRCSGVTWRRLQRIEGRG
jgi:hypothetical protein